MVGWSDGTIRRSGDPTICQFTMPLGTPLQPLQRSFQGVPSGRFIRPSGNHMIERHRDIRAERPLDFYRALGGQLAPAAVDVTLKFDAVLVDFAKALEGEDLKAARVGKQRPLPRHELVEPAELLDDVFAGPDVEVIGVGEHDLRAD